MRKSSLALMLVAGVLALFILANMRSLFTTLEKSEIAQLVAQAELQADLHVLRTLLRQPRPGREGHFERVTSLPAPESGTRQVAAGRERRLEIRRPLGPETGLLFQKTLRSPQLDTLRGMKKVLSGLVLFLGLAIAVGGVYFMALLRRRGPERRLGAGSPFQDYLVEMKRAQLELQELADAQGRASVEKEELNRGIINTVHLGVIFVSAAGKIEIFNPAAQALFRRSLAAAKNHRLADALPGHPELAEFIDSGVERRSAEIESGGGAYFVDVVPVGDAGRLALVRDISEERRRERIRRQNENLMMLGEMTASLAHEVRNSLGVILGYSKGLEGEPEKAERIVREVRFLSEMMESFLRFARPVEKVERRPVDLGPLITAAAAAQEIAVDLPDRPMELSSDPLLLNVVFTNLAQNARQSGAGRLRVGFAPGTAPALTVSDDGPGVPAAAAEKIWLPFFTTRDKGTGMGLATVKKLVGALGGDIRLLNPGEPGAKFKITFYG